MTNISIKQSDSYINNDLDLRNITVSSFKTIQGDSSKYTVYDIDIVTECGLRWTVCKRFSEFYSLHRKLKRYHDVRDMDFPSKYVFFNFSTKTLKKRRDKFNEYLRNLLVLQTLPIELWVFLGIAENAQRGASRTLDLVEAEARESIDRLSCDSDIAKGRPKKAIGYMKKETGGILSHWSQHMFQLFATEMTSILAYYGDNDEKLGVVDLRGYDVEEEDSMIRLTGPDGRELHLQCCEHNTVYWMTSLTAHVEYALSRIPLRMTGFIRKRGHVRKNWKKRFFVLESTATTTMMYYYSKELTNSNGKADDDEDDLVPPHRRQGAGEPKGIINMADYKHRVDTKYLVLESVMTKHPVHTSYHFDFLSEDDRELWIAAIEAHVNYLASVVEE